ncbi:hypothetical protein [Curtobacterium sp. MCSS17_016]|uniref:hypothetical protein n=1 Tax=Curtobacterium sp. MCSS17_016 TaxID=2175644 RepID=UPI000DA94C93|nr:hypothetical protein [Curtobacterium sp. MCSS17_016]WIE81321.1 hypothetical protein DEJ19_018990 [Curtobacterium sp. MCSS17_016]
MTHSELLPTLSQALTLVNGWAAPLTRHHFVAVADGSVGYDVDPDVNGWEPLLDTGNANLACLLTALLSTGAVAHLQQTLQTAITILTETGDEADPAVHLGWVSAREVLTIAANL